MSPVDTTNTTNNTININLDATLGISDTEAQKLVSTLKTNLVGKEGIEDVSYVDGELEVKYKEGERANVDALAAKLQNIVFSSEELKSFLGEDVKDVTFKQNLDGTITLTTNGVSDTKKMSDFDIRELMKLLISAFAELMTADRERALNVLNATVTALENKIDAMETAAKEQYNSAIASAVGQIVSGAVSVATAGIGLGLNLKGPKQTTENMFRGTGDDAIITGTKTSMTKSGAVADFLTSASVPLGKIIEGSANVDAAKHGLAKSEADIDAAKADALLEILRQAQDQYTKGSDSLQQFIDKVLNVMQQLLQSASQTEKAVANI